MGRQLLISEVSRPYAKWVLLAHALLVAIVLAVFVFGVQPAQNKSQGLAKEWAEIKREEAVRRAYAGSEERVEALLEALPQLEEKMQWAGTPTDFSRAVLDAANLAGVTLDQEVNEVHDDSRPVRYVKKLEFRANWERLTQFLKELNDLPLIVVVSSITAAPEEGAEELSVTLKLTGFLGVES